MVFLFIHVAKAVHKHADVATGFAFGLKVEKTNDCPICDYHITKDADWHTVVCSPAPLVLTTYTHIIAYQSRITSSIGCSYTDRGPPVLA